MPPHCDAKDGPVVKAAVRALEQRNVDLVLPYVDRDQVNEVRAAYGKVLAVRGEAEARAVADEWFFETVVRLHRAAEGAPYTGLKPAGLDVGPIIPMAERAIATGSPDELTGALTDIVREQVKSRLEEVLSLDTGEDAPVSERRRYVKAMLGLQVWSHKVMKALVAEPHGSRDEQP